ncbi:prephenate dehydrogenase [Limisphaera sp. VF-2]|uniref:prephenate dehydrogenase n=1 Tax=Limisphaera sp. VF-2 TaxID=3400418 RepID=UPI0017567EB8
MQWKRVSLIGVGLLGGSLGMALKQRRLAREVIGYVRRESAVAECLQAGAVDEATLDLARAVAGADLVVLCTPLGQMPALARAMAAALKRGAVVTDVGSVKAGVVRALEPVIARAGAFFVGSHPMAGNERSGVRAAHPDLFEGAVSVVTPTARTAPKALRQVRRLWRGVGCRLLELSPEEHDRLVSRSSHLPHVTAAALAALVLGPGRPPHQAALCATGFRDTTRVASGSPEMWRDIALANRRHLDRALQELVRHLEGVRTWLARGDGDALLKFFQMAKARRDAWCAGNASPSSE